MVHLRLLTHFAEDELLGADANAIAVGELGELLHRVAIDATAVAATEVFHHRSLVVDDDARVVARDGRIVNGDVAIVPTPYERVAKCQVELLQQEAESVPGGFGAVGVHLGFCASAPSSDAKQKHPQLILCERPYLSSNQTKKNTSTPSSC